MSGTFHKVLEMAPLIPMIEMMNDQNLRGAFSHAMSMPVLRLLAENNEEFTHRILKKLMLNKFDRSQFHGRRKHLADISQDI